MAFRYKSRARSYEWALITGATGGIGRAFATEMPRATNLLLTGRNSERLQALQDELSHPGREVATVAADLATDAGRAALIEKANEVGVDLLISNAATGRLGRVMDHPLEDERTTVEVNVVAPLVLTHALVPGMIERAYDHGGRAGLIIVASTLSFLPVPYFTTYTATKAFELVFAEGLAQELRREAIDVLALCPGLTRTGFGDRAGLSIDRFPVADRPERVAREGLAALGRRTVHVTGLAERAAFNPVALSRWFVGGGIGLAMQLLMRRAGREPEGAGGGDGAA